MTNFAAIVLAAGKSTRMKSSKPKALHPVAGRPMINHIIGALTHAGATRIVLVVGHGADQIKAIVGDHVEYATQDEQRGTGHAAMMAAPLLSDWQGPVLVVPGDAPLVTSDVISALVASHSNNSVTMLTLTLDHPRGYGRIIRDSSGTVTGIVEEKDADIAQKAIREVNVSVYAFDPTFLFQSLKTITPNNAQGELYLTDTVAAASQLGKTIGTLTWDDPHVGLGANNRVELAELDAIMHGRILRNHMMNGVTIVDPLSTRIEAEVNIGEDTTVWPFTVLRGVTDIGANCEIGPGARIDDSTVGDGVSVRDSWIVASEVGSETTVGPFANIRPNSIIGKRVKIGDFVEVKATTISDDVSAGHFAYLGNAQIGDDTNIGAGTITCNYDGINKHETIIGKNVFVGSNSTLVAPVSVGDGAFIAAGSTITENVPSDAIAFGRARQETKVGRAAAKRKELEQHKKK